MGNTPDCEGDGGNGEGESAGGMENKEGDGGHVDWWREGDGGAGGHDGRGTAHTSHVTGVQPSGHPQRSHSHSPQAHEATTTEAISVQACRRGCYVG